MESRWVARPQTSLLRENINEGLKGLSVPLFNVSVR
jgi:hypothetical protein